MLTIGEIKQEVEIRLNIDVNSGASVVYHHVAASAPPASTGNNINFKPTWGKLGLQACRHCADCAPAEHAQLTPGPEVHLA